MYADFLKTLVLYVDSLDSASKASDLIGRNSLLIPYVQFVPVLLEDDLCGFLTDEVGGSYQYSEATETQRAWWKARPK